MTTAAHQTLTLFIRPALAWAGAPYNPRIQSLAAERMMLAIALQESRCRDRIQIGGAGQRLAHLARSLWQIERDGGVAEVCQHPALAWCRAAIMALGYRIDRDELHRAIAYDQTLAAIMARGLLWLDPAPLPVAEEAAYRYYLRRWRPGKPRPETWPENWRIATALVEESDEPSLSDAADRRLPDHHHGDLDLSRYVNLDGSPSYPGEKS